MNDVNMVEYAKQFGNTKFIDLIESQLRSQKPRERRRAMIALRDAMPAALQPHLTHFIDIWNPMLHKREFFNRDTAEVFAEITESAHNFVISLGYNDLISEKLLADFFQLIVINYAHNFASLKECRELVGITYKPRKWRL